jgi:hypothetical protein
MSTPDIEGGEGVVDDVVDAGEAAVVGAIGAAACLACGAKVSGRYCNACGQRHDSMRRNVFVLFWDYLRETFDFDSRMWRTAISLFARPGVAAREYSHGARTRYTPPIRMFLFVSFLFFLTLSLTHTYFAAFDVRYDGKKGEGINFTVGGDDAAEIEREARAAAAEAVGSAPEVSEPSDAAETEPASKEESPGIYVGDGDKPAARTVVNRESCPTGGELKFFVRAKDVNKGRADLSECFKLEVEDNVGQDEEKIVGFIDRAVRGATFAAQNPDKFNESLNDWIPRIMFLMTPILALILSIFFRGKKDALLFDNVLQSLHLHAAFFIITGIGIVAAQFDVPYVGYGIAGALLVYLIAALKNGYGRGWVKTLYSALMISLLYFIVLSSAVVFIVSRILIDAA